MTKFITRAYNNFKLDPVTKSILIKSSKEPRLLDEMIYYENLGDLGVFFPRLFATHKSSKSYKMEIEYYPYRNLGQAMIDDKFNPEFWNEIFNFLFLYFKQYKNLTSHSANNEDSIRMFIHKTVDEYKKLIENFETFSKLSNKEITLNGEILKPFNVIWPEIKKIIFDNFMSKKFYMIHGDFCFNNILFSIHPTTKDVLCKFIDPRGSFGKSHIYGDHYYDLAKLSHSCYGGYEYFINDKFTLTEKSTDFELKFHNNNKLEIYRMFILKMIEQNINVRKVSIIEGLIFIGMCARHYDNLNRQKAMYLTGLKILNNEL